MTTSCEYLNIWPWEVLSCAEKLSIFNVLHWHNHFAVFKHSQSSTVYDVKLLDQWHGHLSYLDTLTPSLLLLLFIFLIRMLCFPSRWIICANIFRKLAKETCCVDLTSHFCLLNSECYSYDILILFSLRIWPF